MEIAVREAEARDLAELVRLYRLLEAEMDGIQALWGRADGLAAPLEGSLLAAIGSPESIVLIASIDRVDLGFLLARVSELLDGERIGSIKLVFVEEEARGVGVGEALRVEVLERLRAAGLALFDAYVLPGHRLAKNFFEQGGFAARSIVMHHADG
jgi:ribosomal protein S18 acetylase RimI-like enzyme